MSFSLTAPTTEPSNRKEKHLISQDIVTHPVDELMTTEQAAHLLKLSPRTLEAQRLKGGGVPYVALSRRAVRYRAGDLRRYIQTHLKAHSADAGGAE